MCIQTPAFHYMCFYTFIFSIQRHFIVVLLVSKSSEGLFSSSSSFCLKSLYGYGKWKQPWSHQTTCCKTDLPLTSNNMDVSKLTHNLFCHSENHWFCMHIFSLNHYVCTQWWQDWRIVILCEKQEAELLHALAVFLPSTCHLKDPDSLSLAVRQVSTRAFHPEDRKTEKDPLRMVGETDAIAWNIFCFSVEIY